MCKALENCTEKTLADGNFVGLVCFKYAVFFFSRKIAGGKTRKIQFRGSTTAFGGEFLPQYVCVNFSLLEQTPKCLLCSVGTKTQNKATICLFLS